jgi:hypothetical protein
MADEMTIMSANALTAVVLPTQSPKLVQDSAEQDSRVTRRALDWIKTVLMQCRMLRLILFATR